MSELYGRSANDRTVNDPRSPEPREPTLAELERADPFVPHDPGCHCWPHVSQRAAIEAAVQAAHGEYREGLKRASSSDELRAALDEQTFSDAVRAVGLGAGAEWVHQVAAEYARRVALASKPSAEPEQRPVSGIPPAHFVC